MKWWDVVSVFGAAAGFINLGLNWRRIKAEAKRLTKS